MALKLWRLLNPIIFLCCLSVTLAEDISTEGNLSSADCSALSWYPEETTPIFDPLASPDIEKGQKELGQLDREIRSIVVERMEKRGWRFTESGRTCSIRYSLILQLDLDVAQHDSGAIAPRNTTGYGGSFPTRTDSTLKKKGVFTLDVLEPESERRLWRGVIEDSLKQGKGQQKKVRDMVRKISEKVPSP